MAVEPDEYNKILVKLKAVRVARVWAVIFGVVAIFNGEYIGAVIMAVLWGLLHFALPVTH